MVGIHTYPAHPGEVGRQLFAQLRNPPDGPIVEDVRGQVFNCIDEGLLPRQPRERRDVCDLWMQVACPAGTAAGRGHCLRGPFRYLRTAALASDYPTLMAKVFISGDHNAARNAQIGCH
jgi:hypothetical protein